MHNLYDERMKTNRLRVKYDIESHYLRGIGGKLPLMPQEAPQTISIYIYSYLHLICVQDVGRIQ